MKSILMRAAALLLVLGGLSASAAAELMGKSEYGAYVVIMEADPVIAYKGDLQKYQATRPGKGRKLDPNSAQVRKYQRFLEDSHAQVLDRAGVSRGQKTHDYSIALNGFAAIMSYEQAGEIARQKGVAMVVPDELRQPMTDSSSGFLGLDDPGGVRAKGYDGENVVIGIIDNGIWPEHPSFVDDGTYAPLPAYEGLPCEFGNTAQNAADAPFTCNNKLLGARQVMPTYRALIGADPDEFDSARDDSGHGTHTASTAGGNAGVQAVLFDRDFGNVTGVAPRARIIAYKGLGKLGGFGSDLAAAIDQAVADGVDVINYSIGSSSFAIGPDDVAFLFAADAGVFVATSNGNSGPEPATTGSPASVPWLTSVGASTQDRTFQGSVLTGDGAEYFGASITEGTGVLPLVDAADAGSELCVPGALDANVVAGNIVLCLRGAIARVDKSVAVLQAGGAGMILYNPDDGASQNTDGHAVPSVHIDNTDGLAIKGYIAAAGAPVASITGGTPTTIDAPWMAGFSSRGPNRLVADLIKPDVTAPGVNILAGASPVNYEGGPQGELFQIISGTSMSSPHVAGLFALLKQAHPDWTPAIAKSALMTTAYQGVKKEDGVTAADPFDMGAGHVDPGGQANKDSIFEPGLAYDAGLFEYAAFTCGGELGVFSAGTCGFLDAIGVPSAPTDLNLPSIGIADVVGSTTVTRTVTSVARESGWRTYVAQVDAPPGFAVDVSPASLRLKRGMSASFEVTVSNLSAPEDSWQFGDLTWVADNGLYEVRSPMAVKAGSFGAPESVAGSGVDGSAAFDVSFGYTGTYAAAAHGLEAAVVATDTVVQDPDQAFDRNDGFSNVHQVTTTGAALLRFAIPPEATEANADLDIFLFDPDGNLVTESTNGGTDEVVEVVLPADGTWTLYVQGWSAPGGDSDYDLYSWVVSATPGGNMTVDAAPTTAALGSTDPVAISWTGASAGQWHLGAVSHTGPDGLLGLTLVEVDNR
ncbi:MAG TPA: S8 family serine peptidase [Pseudomonadales bacterium]|nr:S8 family serine peptidase [Pseudomonadales bacterium]